MAHSTLRRLQTGRSFRPLIEHGHVQDSHAKGKVVDLKRSYGLWLIESGMVVLEESGSVERRLSPPALYLSQPGTRAHPGAGTHYRYIAFVDDARKSSVALPEVVPNALFGRGQRLLYVWTNNWWRSELDLLRCNAQLSLFLLDLCDGAASSQPEQIVTDLGMQEQESASWLAHLQALIKQDLPHGPTAATMAVAMGLSRSQLYRKLASYTDRSVKEVIDEIRLQEATRLLLKPEYRVASVGRMVGLARSTVFTRWFRKHTGASPTAWRKEMIPGFSLGRIAGKKRRDLGDWDKHRRYP